MPDDETTMTSTRPRRPMRIDTPADPEDQAQSSGFLPREAAAPAATDAGRRTTMPAGAALVAMLVGLLVWLLLYAPSLKRSAEASQLGTRRSVALAILRPIAALSEGIGVGAAGDSVQRALGRDPSAAPGGVFVPPPEALPGATGSDGQGQPGQNPNGSGPKIDPDAPIRVPTNQRKLRIAVVGDSLAAGLGYFAERVFEPRLTRVLRQGRISTGLARPDYFNWPAAMRQIVDGYNPDLVIVLTGENDNQGLLTPSGKLETPVGSTEWPPAYQERVEQFMRIATSGGAKVVWGGLPIQAERSRWDHIKRQNEVFEAAAEAVPNVAYFDTWDEFAARDGGYTAFYWNNGHVTEVREADGIHFNADGYELIVRRMAELAEERFGLDPKSFS